MVLINYYSLILAVGLVINALPHFIIDDYKPPLPQNILCGLPPGFAPPVTNTTPVNGTGGGLPTCDSEDIAERYGICSYLFGLTMYIFELLSSSHSN